jgi:ABC-type phosphate/phosphonate transport system substrate-binding protein
VWVARKEVSTDERERFARALLALKKGEDDSILSILRAKTFVVASDREYETLRQVAHELGMF